MSFSYLAAKKYQIVARRRWLTFQVRLLFCVELIDLFRHDVKFSDAIIVAITNIQTFCVHAHSQRKQYARFCKCVGLHNTLDEINSTYTPNYGHRKGLILATRNTFDEVARL